MKGKETLFSKAVKFRKLESFCNDFVEIPINKDFLIPSGCCVKKEPLPENGSLKIWMKVNKPCKNPEYETTKGEETLIVGQTIPPFDLLPI